MIRFVLILAPWFLRALPRVFRLGLGKAIGWFWFHILRFRRGLVLEHLRLAFGSEKSEADILRLASKNFENYGHILVEFLLSIGWSPQKVRENIPFDGLDHLQAALAKGKGVFALTLHLANWEWMAGSLASHFPTEAVAKHTKNPAVDEFLLWQRNNMGLDILYESGTARDILRALGKNKIVIFANDQFMGPPIGLPVRFFGKRAGTAVGLALLSERCPAPIVPVYAHRDERGVLRVVAEPELKLPPFSENKDDRLYEKTQYFNDFLEARVREYPDQWLWLHRRWKAYRGEPRWQSMLHWVPTAGLLVGLLAACASPQTRQETPTGIAIPAEVVVNVPDVAQVENAGVAPAPPPAVTKKLKKVPIKPESLPSYSGNPKVFRPDQIPFEIGERMVIGLRWSALSAGEVRMEVREGLGFQGRDTFKIWANVLSSPVVDAIYHIDNTVESYVDKEWLLPYKFLLHMVETHQLKETRAVYDHKLNKVHYWSKRLSKKWGDEVQDRIDDALPLAQDMFSGLYYARVLDYKLGEPREIPIYENKQNVVATLMPVGKEMIHTKAGAFQCWKLAVTLKINNVLRPTGETVLWLSDDWKKYIVKFDAKLKFGSLIGELNSVRERK